MTSADLQALLQAGRLSQRCPGCGTVEAAGSYCTRCHQPAGSTEWFRQERGRPASSPQKPPENGINRGPGRPRRHVDGDALSVTAPAYSPESGLWPHANPGTSPPDNPTVPETPAAAA